MAFGDISFDDIPETLPKGTYLFEIVGSGEFEPDEEYQDHLAEMPNIGKKVNLTLKCEVSEDNEEEEFRGVPVRDVYLPTYPETKSLRELKGAERRTMIDAMNNYRRVLISLGVEDSNAAIRATNMEDLHGVKFLAKTYVSEHKETGIKSTYLDLKSIKLAASISRADEELVDFE
jgi:hypothetical protein